MGRKRWRTCCLVHCFINAVAVHETRWVFYIYLYMIAAQVLRIMQFASLYRVSSCVCVQVVFQCLLWLDFCIRFSECFDFQMNKSVPLPSRSTFCQTVGLSVRWWFEVGSYGRYGIAISVCLNCGHVSAHPKQQQIPYDIGAMDVQSCSHHSTPRTTATTATEKQKQQQQQ